MTELKVLVEGYVREEGDVEFASCSTTLIRDNELNIVIDPGMNRKLLIDALTKENLTPQDINYVILTHTHIDHMLLSGIFENATILDDSSMYGFDGRIEDHEGFVPSTNVKIISTPGHDQFHCSVLVETEDLGKVMIAADVFWWVEGQEQKTDKESLMGLEDPYVKDPEALSKSREKVLSLADYVIPGHGKMFKVEK